MGALQREASPNFSYLTHVTMKSTALLATDRSTGRAKAVAWAQYSGVSTNVGIDALVVSPGTLNLQAGGSEDSQLCFSDLVRMV